MTPLMKDREVQLWREIVDGDEHHERRGEECREGEVDEKVGTEVLFLDVGQTHSALLRFARQDMMRPAQERYRGRPGQTGAGG